MACKIPHAEMYRTSFPNYSDDQIYSHLRHVDREYPHTSGPAFRTPEWCVYRALIRREARKRGITL